MVECQGTFEQIMDYMYKDLDQLSKIQVNVNRYDSLDHEFIFTMKDGSYVTLHRTAKPCLK